MLVHTGLDSHPLENKSILQVDLKLQFPRKDILTFYDASK